MADERKINNFQRLMEEEYEPRFTLPQMMKIEDTLKRRQNSMRTAGDVIDLYLPKVLKAFVHLLGGSDNDDDNGIRPIPSDFNRLPKSKGPQGPGNR
jgi:hypothetical protein